ncbi:MAG: ABC transporter ATP-binding protein [Planctomycetes bacterium]|nr:ABC transporter ATP-binding protein [Planctomycetota bacterium]
MIEACNLIKRYGPFLALDHVSFGVGKGRVAGFLGLNGAGKTTTLRIASCYMPPSSGWLKIAGFDSVRQSEDVRRRIGYLPERVPLYDDLRVSEYLRFRARLKGVRGGEVKAAVERVIGHCGLESKRNAPIATLSKGFRQRVGIADALVHEPDLLLLDEPTSGLDPDQRIELRGLIRGLGEERTVLLSTHILSEAEATCDDVIVIHRGRIRAADRLERLRDAGPSGYRVRHSAPALDVYGKGMDPATEEGVVTVMASDRKNASRVAAAAVNAGRDVLEVTQVTATLEEVFIRLTTSREGAA